MIMILVIFILFLLSMACLFQEYIMFNPGWRFYPLPENPGFTIEDVYFPTEDGHKIHGWHIYPSKIDSSFTILICHGTRGNLTEPFRVSLIQALSELGMEMFIFDYSGIGRSDGRVSENNAYRDAMAAFRYVSSYKGLSNEQIIVFGRSLGGPVACKLAAEIDPFLLILESTFYSMAEEVHYLLPFVPEFLIRGIVGDRFPTYRYYRDVRCPSLCLHGNRDRLVPCSSGQRLYGESSNPLRVFITMEGGGHKFFLNHRNLYVTNLLRGLSLVSPDYEKDRSDSSSQRV